MTIDTRVLERRREVAEDLAKQNLARLVRMVSVLAPLAALAWLAFSPWLSVSRVAIEGAEKAAVYEVLSEHQMVVGTPMILLDAELVESELEADPWIAEATVSLLWPDEVSVSVMERLPVAWVQTREGWSRRDRDGVAVPSPDAPDATLAVILLPDMGDDEAAGSPELAGALEWMEALPVRLYDQSNVTLVEGELWAEVAGHRVRLGRPVEMAAKAKSLAALLAKGLDADAEINVVAPTHPAVSTPSGSEEDAEP